jgi:hypothetical protein
MSDVLVQFDEPQLSADGRMFTAQVLGARLPTGLWEAWIEFHPRIGGEPVRTPRETEQLSRGDLRFWAAGITREHLRTALSRALDPSNSPQIPTIAENAAELDDDQTAVEIKLVRDAEPVLDPMGVYRHSGEYCLRQELRALDAQQLATIISVHGIEDMDVVDLARTYEDALAERIVASVQHNVVREQTVSGPLESRASK